MSSISAIIQSGENLHVEFKATFNAAVIETLVAFANAKGGAVYIGIADDASIIGTDVNNESVQQWINEVKSKTIPQLIPSAESYSVEGKTIIELHTSEYPLKPVSVKGIYYKRIHNANHQLTAGEVANMHLQTVNSSWDFYPRSGKTLADISIEKIQKVISTIKKRNPDSVIESVPEFLSKNELIHGESITNACYLLFCKEDSLFTSVQMGLFQDEITIKDDVTISCDILSQVDEVMTFIKKHINKEIIISQQVENIQRWQYPLDAVRELVLNMIIHRDYTASADSIIKIFPNYIIFYNPGALPDTISVEQLLANNYVSSPRNKQVAKIVKDLGWIEKYGTGIKRVRQLFVEYGLPEPEFSCVQGGLFVKAWGIASIHSIELPDDVTDKVTDKVTDTQRKILELVSGDRFVSAAQMAESIGISKRKIIVNLNKLKSLNLLKRVGGTKNGHWEVVE